MRIGSIEVCYIPYNKSQYQIAQEEMAKVSLREVKNVLIGATFITLTTVNMLYAKVDVAKWKDKVNTEGNKILEMVQVIGYWCAIIFAAIDIIKNFKKQDITGIVSTALKYVVTVAILYGLPSIFDLAAGMFSD